MKGINNLKAGVLFDDTILTENDRFGIVDPGLNPVCLNADGSPYTGPDITDPAACSGNLTANPGFVPTLGCVDLTRTAPLPASDGCPQSTSASYLYRGHANIHQTALYIQDTLRLKNLDAEPRNPAATSTGDSVPEIRPSRASASLTT